MEDPEPQSDEERQRRAEAAMEEFLRAQEEAEQEEAANLHQQQQQQQQQAPEGDGGNPDNPQLPPQDDWIPQAAFAPDPLLMEHGRKPFRLSYTSASFLVAFAMIFYALRTRQQWYLALVYLSSSKWAYIVLGNALVAALITVFGAVTNIFLNGLRLHEAEGLGDFFRWNITETCLALTMFRSELTVKTGVLFLILVMTKCLHWVCELRESHLRMTQEAIRAHPTTGWPALQWTHLKLLLCLMALQLMDILAVLQCGHDILKHGPSVSILFAFEGAILLVSVMSSILLWYLHVVDGVFQYWHETTAPGHRLHGWIHPWKDHKATLVFAVEVQAQAAKFVFYVTFFAIVMTYYGLPINLFREVYMSFQSLRQRLVAFGKYRQLMANMNRFANPTAEELEEAGSICIICRDEMTVETTKQLPGCGHLFHKSCLREWLVQQQSCPTCRGDIATMQVRQRQQDLANQRQRERQEEQEENGDQATGEAQEGQGGAPTNRDGSGQDSSAATDDRPPTGDDHRKSPDDEDHPSQDNARKDRSIRFLGPSSDPSHSTQDDGSAFPAFYRVVQDQGTPVYRDTISSVIIRMVPFGVVILGQDLSWRDCDGKTRLMMRMPDGWVVHDDVERIIAVPIA